MKDFTNFSTAWIPRTVGFSLQIYFRHFGTGEVVLASCAPHSFKVADIVAADTISSPEDGATLSNMHRAALITGPVPLDEVALPPTQLKIGFLGDVKNDYASAEAAFFQKLGIDLKTSDPDPVLMLLLRLFFLDKSSSPQRPLPQRPPCLPAPSEILLVEGPESSEARKQYAYDNIYLQLPCKIATLPRASPRIFEKQVYETNALLLSFEGVRFELAEGVPLEPMYCSAVLVSRSGDGEFLSQTFHFDAVDETMLQQSSGDSVKFNPFTRHRDVLLQLSSLSDCSNVWLVVFVEKSMGFHTQKPYLDTRVGNIEELRQRLTSNCMLYGKYRRPFVWGYTEIYYSRNSYLHSSDWNACSDEYDVGPQMSSIFEAVGIQKTPSPTWLMGRIKIPNLYLVSDFCENFSKPFSIFESMNRIDSKRKQYNRVNGSLQFVLQPWSGSDSFSPGPHCISSIVDLSGSHGQNVNCYVYRPGISFSYDAPPNNHRVVFSSQEPVLHSHMRHLRCHDDLVNSLYLTNLSVDLQGFKVRKNFGERDNYVLRICFKESDNSEEDGKIPAMVMKSSSEFALASEAYTHVVMNVSHCHFIDEIRIELRPQLHCSSHLLITLMRVARRSKVSTFFKSAPSMDDHTADVIVGHAVLKFCCAQELAACCTTVSLLPLIEHPLKPGYLTDKNNSYLAGKLPVLKCQLRLQSSIYPATPIMAQIFTSLSSFHELSLALQQFIIRGSGLSLTCARRDLAADLRKISQELLELTSSVDMLEIAAFFPAVATFLVHIICSSHHFYLYEKSREDPFAQAQPLAVLCAHLSRQSLLSLMYFVNAIASRNSELNLKNPSTTLSVFPVSFDGGTGVSSSLSSDTDREIIDSDACPAPNVLWFLHRAFDDNLTFASTGRSSSVLLAEVWSRSLQEQLPDVMANSSVTSNKSAGSRPTITPASRHTFTAASRPTVAGKSASIRDGPSLTLETSKLNKDSTCSIAWFMFSLIRKGMLLHLQRNDLNSDGFAPNSLHPVRKMLVENSLEIINTLTSFLLVSFVDNWPGMQHDTITTRCFKYMVLFIRDCGPMFGSAFVVTSMQSILLKIKQHTDPDPRKIFTYKAQIRLLEILYDTPHILILNRLATLDRATPLDSFMLMRHCAHFALLCAHIDELRHSPFDQSNYLISFQLAWNIMLRLDSMDDFIDRELRQKIAMLFWPLLCNILWLYHLNVAFFECWSQPFKTKFFTMCLFVVANVPRPNLVLWLENQTDSCLISLIDLLKDIFEFVAPIYTVKKNTGQDSNAMLVSALSILSYVVLSPELGGDSQSDRIMQQRASKPDASVNLPELEVEELLSVSRDASDSCLWSLLNVLSSLLDALALRHPSKRSAQVDVSAAASWNLIKNHCFRAIKSCALRFDLLVASSDSVPLQFVKSLTDDKNLPLFCLSAARMYYIDNVRKYITSVGLNEDDWRELFLLNLQNICSNEPDFVEFGRCYHRLLSECIPSSPQTDHLDFHHQRVRSESTDSLVFDPDAKSLVSIHAATCDALIQVLVSRLHPSNTPIFKTFFFMWYCLKPLKISARYLLKCLVLELELAMSEQRLPDLIHVVGLILKWLEDYVEDFSAILLSNLLDLCDKWRSTFMLLCAYDFSTQITFQLYRKLAHVLRDLKHRVDSRHFTPRTSEKSNLQASEEVVKNEPADASRLLAMALAVAVSEAPKAAAFNELDEVSQALVSLSRVPSISDIDEAINAFDKPGLCTCILLELGAQEIATILTKTFFDTFCHIPPREFARKALGETSDKYPNYSKATKNSERLSHWIRCMVLMEGRLEFRRKLCSLFVEVCHRFLQCNDFNGLAAVYTGGLSSTAIYRLTKSTGFFTYKEDKRVPREEFESIFDHALAEKYESVKVAMSTDKNFTNYRQRLERAELPCFPYMGTFVTDAVFAWDGKGERAMKFPDNCIDLRRPIKVAGIIINNLSLYQKHQFLFEVDPDKEKKLFATFNAPLLLKLELLKEKNANAYDDFCILLSKNIEPEERKQAFPSFSAEAASHGAVQAAATIARSSASPNAAASAATARAAVVVQPAAPTAAVAFSGSSASPASVAPATPQTVSTLSPDAVYGITAGSASSANTENAVSPGSCDAHASATQDRDTS